MTPALSYTGWIIYPRYVARHSDNAFGWLTDEAAACGIDLHVLFAEELTVGYGHGAPSFWHRGTAVTRLPDFAIVRTYDTVLSRALERAGVPLINSSASMELCKNKMLTHELLAAAGIPTPLTLYAPEGEYDYDHVAGVLGSERFVVKRIDGAKGEDVFLIDDALPPPTRGAWRPCGRPWRNARDAACASSSLPRAADGTCACG